MSHALYRRPWFAAVASCIAAVAVLTACTSSSSGDGDSSSTPSSPAASGSAKPVSGGSLRYGIDQGLDNINPAISGTDISPFIGRNIFDSLVVQKPGGKFGPWLATSWIISPDGLTYTFKLKTGVNFHDGSTFDAASVKAFLDYVKDPATKSTSGAALLSFYKSTTVIDPQTVEITLTQPYGQFLQALSTPTLGIQSTAAITAPVAEYKPIGTGPFKFVSWTQKVSVVLEANPSYNSPPADATHAGAPYLKKITFQFLNENSTRYGALTSGQVDAINAVPPNSISNLKSMSGFSVRSGFYPGLNYDVFLKQSGGILADTAVRQALVHSVDMDALVKSVYFGTATVAKNVVSPTTPGYDASAEASVLTYDPAKANALLDQAGWTGRDSDGIRTKNGQKLSLQWPIYTPAIREQRDVLDQGIQAEAKKVGIGIVRPQISDISKYIGGYISGTWDLFDVSQIRSSSDGLRRYFTTDQALNKGGSNLLSLSSSELDGYLNAAAATSDPAEADKNYASAEQFILANTFAMPTYIPSYNMGLSKKVQGVDFDVQGLPEFVNVWIAA